MQGKFQYFHHVFFDFVIFGISMSRIEWDNYQIGFNAEFPSNKVEKQLFLLQL